MKIKFVTKSLTEQRLLRSKKIHTERSIRKIRICNSFPTLINRHFMLQTYPSRSLSRILRYLRLENFPWNNEQTHTLKICGRKKIDTYRFFLPRLPPNFPLVELCTYATYGMWENGFACNFKMLSSLEAWRCFCSALSPAT